MENKNYFTLNFFYNFLIHRKTMIAINTFFPFANKVHIFALVFHLVLALWALEKKHFGLNF